ncbi:MAG: aldo/keto reductase [Xanthobacteraceae bacterium]|nr:aldo/keto reductase [Xanthobacteraceae bacterium]
MRYNLLGNSGLYVSELCLGTMTFGGQNGGIWENIGKLQIDDVSKIVKTAFDSGINFFDTANVYSFGQSELLLGEAIHQVGLPRHEIVIATKATSPMSSEPNNSGHSRYHIMNQVDESLKRLKLDHIDLYQLHGVDRFTPTEEVLRTLDDIVRSGKARYIGVSNWSAWQIAKALGISERRGFARFESVQSYYTIAGRDLERELVPMAKDQKIGIMAWSPLAGGLLSGKYDADGKAPAGSRRLTFDFPIVDRPRAQKCIDAMRPIAQRHSVSVARVALGWLLHQPHVTSVIIGAKTTDQLGDNIASTTLKLSEEDLKALNEASALPPEYPGWMIERQTTYRPDNPTK